MKVPMVDAAAQYRALRQEIDSAVHEVLESGHYILGHNVEAFEREVAEYCGVGHAVSVASGTDALHLALRAAGIEAGDEVITTCFSFIATAEAISYVGARPIFVDVEPDTLNIDVANIEAVIGPRTRAIVVVHLYGQPADLAAMRELCDRRGLALIEDCAQAFGAVYQGRRVGSWGDLGCFSFYPSKTLGGAGDGGMVTTNSAAFAERIRVLRNHGASAPGRHEVIGYNSRLDELQAAILRVKLKEMDRWNEARYDRAQAYHRRLEHSGLELPVERPERSHVYHQFTIQSAQRDTIRQALADAEIASAIYYPVPMHRQPVYAGLASDVSLPNAEHAAQRVLSLPIFPELTDAQIDEICACLLQAL